jgi:hypothetical protein
MEEAGSRKTEVRRGKTEDGRPETEADCNKIDFGLPTRVYLKISLWANFNTNLL